MAGKKPAAPSYVYVVLNPAMYGMHITIQGVYVDHEAALEAASNEASLVTRAVLNYHGADDTTNGNIEGESDSKAKTSSKPKASKTEKDSNGEGATKASSKKKSIPDGEPNSLAGQTLASSGSLRTLDRSTFEQTVEKFGGTFTSKFTDSTTIVLGENPGSKKIEEINNNNYATMSEEEFYATIGADFAPPAKKAKKQ